MPVFFTTSSSGNELEGSTLKDPTFTGVPRAPTAASGTNTTQIATTDFVQDAIIGKAEKSELNITNGNVSKLQSDLLTKEQTGNKSSNPALGASDDFFPTQNAVKTYVDTQIDSKATPDAETMTKGKIQLAGELGGTASSPTISNDAVIWKRLTGYVAPAGGIGIVSSADSIKQAIEKLDGNMVLKADKTYVDKEISDLVGGAPGLLNTLNELSAAINDDANFSTNLVSALSSKAATESPIFTGVPLAPTATTGTNTTQIATTAFVENAIAGKVAILNATQTTSQTALQTAIDTKATQSDLTNVQYDLIAKASLPQDNTFSGNNTFTGALTLTSPLPAKGSDTTDVATTAFVKREIDDVKNIYDKKANPIKFISDFDPSSYTEVTSIGDMVFDKYNNILWIKITDTIWNKIFSNEYVDTNNPTTNPMQYANIINQYTTSIWLDTNTPNSNFVLNSSNISSWLDKTSNKFNLKSVGTITYNSTSPKSLVMQANTFFKQNISASKFNMLASLQTWFFVVSFPTIIGESRIVGMTTDGTYGFNFKLINNSRFIINNITGNGSVGIGFNHSFEANTKYLFSISLNLNNSRTHSQVIANSILRLNGTTKTLSSRDQGTSSFGLPPTDATSSLLIGAVTNNATYYMNENPFNIHELIGINNEALGMDDMKTIESYLNTKWSLGYTIN